MEIKVLKHHCRRFSLLEHKAIVVIEGDEVPRLEEAIDTISAKCGYHPFGYGIYGFKSLEALSPFDDTYIATWQTGTHCD